jgi:propionyl-CoA carboxylase alpha chain
MSFDKVLIANRGEIALRIMRTLKRMGIKTVAVYSEADTNALHVQYADEAVYIGPSPATSSYLSIPRLLDAIRKSGAQAVHPGYGFLSENPAFARALRDEGVALIGPRPETIEAMGDKIEAKKLAAKAGVSTIPGYMGVIENSDQAAKIAASIGYPVMLKAAAGGGGRGMRIIRNESEVRDAFASASREAKTSFSDDRVFLEKFIEKPRHIEIQLLGDRHGNAVCLGERECSIQRYHQKVIEEAPSPFLDEVTRQKMYDQVVALAQKVGYDSAGTVEFMVDQERNFYFLEMNTRLQVEHCVTELITGIDLVEMMVRIAGGEPLPFKQEDIQLNGWAIESRICAEDPSRGFLPSSGRISEYRPPKMDPNIRLDSGVNEGGEVSMFYDPMIAKLCTHAATRDEAIAVMQRALSEFVLRGISHNISFLEAIMGHHRFKSGDINTHFIAEEYPDGFLGASLTSEVSRIFLAVALHMHITEANRATTITDQMRGRPRQIGTRWVVNIEGVLYPASLKPIENGFLIKQDRERIAVRSNWVLGSRLFRATVNDEAVSVRVDILAPGEYSLTYGGTSARVSVRTPRVAELERFMPPRQTRRLTGEVRAPLSGLLVALKVAEGDAVKVGQDLCVVEAMKMENIVVAQRSGIIKDVSIAPGDTVMTDQLLCRIVDPTPVDV